MLTTEWLLDVTRRRNGFAELVQIEGELVPAAWRLRRRPSASVAAYWSS